jgi:hypothetical protein
VIAPTVADVGEPTIENALKVTPLTVAAVPDPKLAEATREPVVSTCDPVPEIVTGVPQLITAAFAGSTANERASAVTVTAAKMFKDLCMIKNSQLRGKQTRLEEERRDL